MMFIKSMFMKRMRSGSGLDQPCRFGMIRLCCLLMRTGGVCVCFRVLFVVFVDLFLEFFDFSPDVDGRLALFSARDLFLGPGMGVHGNKISLKKIITIITTLFIRSIFSSCRTLYLNSNFI